MVELLTIYLSQFLIYNIFVQGYKRVSMNGGYYKAEAVAIDQSTNNFTTLLK